MWWIVLALLLGALTVVGAWLSRRFGRGALEQTFRDPINEVQDTTPRKIWP